MKVLKLVALLPLCLAAACGEESDPAKDAADVAEIREMYDNPPAVPIEPQRISYTDVENNNLFGAGCGFAPKNGLSVIAMAQAERGFLKLKDEIITLSPDKGGETLPMASWQHYSGADFAFTLKKTSDVSEESGVETTSWPGSLTITDRQEKVVYEAEGTLQCGA